MGGFDPGAGSARLGLDAGMPSDHGCQLGLFAVSARAATCPSALLEFTPGIVPIPEGRRLDWKGIEHYGIFMSYPDSCTSSIY